MGKRLGGIAAGKSLSFRKQQSATNSIRVLFVYTSDLVSKLPSRLHKQKKPLQNCRGFRGTLPFAEREGFEPPDP